MGAADTAGRLRRYPATPNPSGRRAYGPDRRSDMNRMDSSPGYASLLVVGLVIALAATDPAVAAPAAGLMDRSLSAVRAESPPTIDGRLDDVCWSQCEVTGDFFDASRGLPPTQPTEVRVCFDDAHVYVAFVCFEERMDSVSAAITQRDAGGMFEVDDCVAVLLDTYHDQRSCYAFATNMVGTRLDLRVADAGESQEIAWDAVWDAAAHRDDDRWTAEFAIPLSELRFAPGESMTWGAEFLRHQTQNREDSRWIHYEGEVLDPAYYGDLCGISCSNSAYGLDVTLTAVGRYDEADVHDYPLEPDDAAWDVHPDAGLDVEWVPRPTLTVSATLNPDFAQIEGDPNQVNLTGDELSLDERRPFFSEGMEVFQTPLTILYTRRMEDITYGTKAGGRFGTTNVGALYVRSSDLQRTPDAEVITDEFGVPLPAVDGDYAALAVKQDVLGSSSLGGYYVARERGEDDYSRVAAATLFAPVLEHGRATAMAARTFNPGETGEDNAYWIGLDYERSRFSSYAGFEWIGEDFVPETGFVRVDRRGRVGGYVEFDREFQMGGDAVEELGVDVFGGRYEGVNGGREFWYAGSVFSTVFTNRIRVAARAERSYDEIDYPEYPESTTGRVELTTNLGAWSGYIAGFSYGDYHNSTYYRGDAIACLQPHERLTFDMRLTGVFLRDYEDVDWIVERVRSDWMINRSSFLRLIAQGANIRWGMEGGDYRSQQYDLNVLYGWEFSPGSMFYLAYNQPMERADGENEFLDPVVVAKVSYMFGL
jgi:hypothetical protein